MLSNSIYFFHDISSNKKDEQLTNSQKGKNEAVQHIFPQYLKEKR